MQLLFLIHAKHNGGKQVFVNWFDC